MIATDYALWAIIGMAGVTIALRALPFLAAPWLRRFAVIGRLGRFLPAAILTLLLLDTLRGSMTSNPGGPWQELLATAVTLMLHWRWRHPLLSIFGGTLLYMALRHGGVAG